VNTRFQDLRNTVSIAIVDNDCPVLVKPLNGAVSLPYSQTLTKTHCNVVCDPGYRMDPMGEPSVSDASDAASSSADPAPAERRFQHGVPEVSHDARPRAAEKVTICHATGSASNPYVQITVSASAVLSAHENHDGDIIPAPSTGCSAVVKLTCNKATGTWDRQLPDCKFCAAGYFNASGTCLPCSSSQCPAGRYRAACTPQSDAICKMCNDSTKPSHAHWTPGGVPFDGNRCHWTCDVGYIIENVTFQNASKLCIKLPSNDVRDDPIDTDQDGIPDMIEGDDSIDTDHDGVPDYRDLDSDNDGIPDAVEGAEDTDLDGLRDYIDKDSDNDTIPDEEEGTDDFDDDGVPNYIDLDSDNDSLPDEYEGSSDQDGDNRPNYLDLDADGDGILDRTEGKSDPDGDSVPSFLDLDSDGDGLPDSFETDVDSDGDSVEDFLDTDSDNDSVPDAMEGGFDSDNDGTPDFRDLDSDGDGILDKTEGIVDTDNDNVPDRLDLDSDNDCLGDRQEGVPNWRFANRTACGSDSSLAPLDTDGDGLLDSYEGNADVDQDGIPNYLDLDSDGDGISDESEGSGDVDNDSVPNFLDLDSDGDSIQDCEEGAADQDQDGTLGFRV
jgi:hypothetical protein